MKIHSEASHTEENDAVEIVQTQSMDKHISIIITLYHECAVRMCVFTTNKKILKM